jgi:hypothetical protein
MESMSRDIGKVNNPDRDKRVSDADRFLDDRRRECLAMIRLWRRSKKPDAKEDLAYWREQLKEIDLKAARIQLHAESRDRHSEDDRRG